MTPTSQAYTELFNLMKIAESHKETCTNPDCGVTFYMLKKTAERLIKEVYPQEYRAAKEVLDTIGEIH